MFIQIDGNIVNPDLVAVVKPIDDEHCSLFTAGQSAIDGGFLINLGMEDVLQILNIAHAKSLMEMIDEETRREFPIVSP